MLIGKRNSQRFSGVTSSAIAKLLRSRDVGVLLARPPSPFRASLLELQGSDARLKQSGREWLYSGREGASNVCFSSDPLNEPA